MRKTIAVISIGLALLCVLSGCVFGKPSKQPATPGDLVTDNGHTLHESTGRKDVSADYAQQLCSYAWLDTDSFTYYLLQEDGSFVRTDDEDYEEQIGTGTWKLYQDEQNYLCLSITEDGSGELLMNEVELFEQCMYAYGDDGASIVWLLMNDAEA